MAIKEKGYSRWEGSLDVGGRHWLPIFTSGIRAVWKRKYSKLAFSFALMPFLIFLVAIYAISKPELKMFAQMIQSLKSDPLIFNKFFTNGFLVFMMMILSILSGSELISSDLRARALPLYFARPLSKRDYLTGKFSIMLFYLLLFTLVPGLLLFLAKLLFTGTVSGAGTVLFGIFFFSLAASLFLTSMTLGFSILSPNTRLVRILIVVVFIFSDNIAQTLSHILGSDYFYLLSVQKNMIQLGRMAFGTGDRFNYPPAVTLAVMLGLSLGFCALLYFKVRRVEALS